MQPKFMLIVDGSKHRCAYAKCPGCGIIGLLDQDQYEGRVSMLCDCGYHETHDMREGTAVENFQGLK